MRTVPHSLQAVSLETADEDLAMDEHGAGLMGYF